MEDIFSSPPVQYVADLLKATASTELVKPSYKGCSMWYISPEQNAFELILFNLIYGIGMICKFNHV
jgi:hypothetical protein